MSEQRIYWIDFLKGLAIISMIVYHFAFNLNLLNIYPIDVYSGLWIILARFIQFTFLTVVGISIYISYAKHQDYSKFLKRQFRRSVILLGIAMGITLVTYIFYPQGYIKFGVLHLISIASILGALLIRNNFLMVCLIFISLILGNIFSQITLDTPLLMPLGLMYKNFYSLDYFPIFPWISLVFAGIVIARFLDKHKLLKNFNLIPRFKLLEDAGKRSLIIYLVHQPVLLGLIWLLSKINVLK
jgi:uncharacterized membrane protein